MADFVAGDSDSTLTATLIRRDGSVFDLTGHTAKLRYRIGSTPYSLKIMTLLSPLTAGRVSYPFAAADLTNEGIMYAEIEVTETSSGKIVSNSTVQEFIVRGKTTLTV